MAEEHNRANHPQRADADAHAPVARPMGAPVAQPVVTEHAAHGSPREPAPAPEIGEHASIVAREAPTVVDFPVHPRGIGRRLLTSLAIMIIFLLLLTILGILAAMVNTPFGLAVVTITFVVVAVGVIGLTPVVQRSRAKRRARRMFDEDPSADVSRLVGRVMHARPWFSGLAAITALSETLVAANRSNIVIRMAGYGKFWPIRPTECMFEPRQLDESDPTFVELADATAAENDASGFEFTSSDQLPLRNVSRNIRMKGGYFSLILICLFWCWHAFDSYVTGRPTLWFGFFSVILFIKLFGRATGGLGAIMWYLVPRGVVLDMRKSPKAGGFRLCDRLKSVLVVHQTTRYTWTVFVVDHANDHRTMATSREVELLLRTWTSAVAPPSAEIVASLLGAEREALPTPETVGAG